MPTENSAPVEERLSAYFAQSRGIEEKAPEPEQEEPEVAQEAPAEAPEKPQESAEPETATEAPEDDAETVETLSDLAGVLGVDVSELYNIRVPVTGADGSRAEVSLSEWKDGYQASEQVRKASADLERKRAALEQESARAHEQIQQQLQQTGALLNSAEQQLLSDYKSVDWDGLRQSDPSEWAAKRQDFIERQNAINTAKQQAISGAERLRSEQGQKTEKQRQEVLQKEAAALVAAIPEWQDEGTAKAEQAQLVEYLVGAGFPREAVSEISNHRLVVLARKAMQFDKQATQTQAAKKKMVKVAKRVLKPGAADAKAQQTQETEAKLRARLKKTGSDADAFALLKHRRQRQ